MLSLYHSKLSNLASINKNGVIIKAIKSTCGSRRKDSSWMMVFDYHHSYNNQWKLGFGRSISRYYHQKSSNSTTKLLLTTKVKHSSGSSSLLVALSTLLITFLPIAIYVRDNCFSFMKVKGSSMEPMLKDGDIILIRRADFLFFNTNYGFTISFGNNNKESLRERENGSETKHEHKNHSNNNGRKEKELSQKNGLAMDDNHGIINYPDNNSRHYKEEIAHLMKEEQEGEEDEFYDTSNTDFYALLDPRRHPRVMGNDNNNNDTKFSFYTLPPLVLPGQIVVCKSPFQYYPSNNTSTTTTNNNITQNINYYDYIIKRTIGIAGQWVEIESGNENNYNTIHPLFLENNSSTTNDPNKISKNKKFAKVPTNHIWLESDSSKNRSLSSDSSQTMGVSHDKKGIEESKNDDDNKNDKDVDGLISRHLLIGIAEYVVWPPSRYQKLSGKRQTQKAKRGFYL